MASVEKVTTSAGVRWRARYRSPEGKSREKWFPKRSDAERFLTSTEHKKMVGEYVDPGAGKVTFEAYAEQWRSVQAHRPSTQASVETNLRRHVYPVLGSRPLGAIQRSEVQAWVKGLTLAPATVELIYRHVSAIFRSAVEDRVIASSPCRRIALPEKPRAEVIIPTVEQVGILLDTVPERYRALVILCAGTGLRQGEAFGLTVDRVDWLRRTVTVDRQLVMLPGNVASFGPPKTKASYRTVPVPDTVLAALTEHRRAFGGLAGLGGKARTSSDGGDATISGLIFTNEKGGGILRTEFARAWRPAREAAGLPARTGLHLLRHFYASALIRHGESPKVVQARLGHASVVETLDTYSHLWPDSEDRTRQAAAEALVGLSWGSEGRQAL